MTNTLRQKLATQAWRAHSLGAAEATEVTTKEHSAKEIGVVLDAVEQIANDHLISTLEELKSHADKKEACGMCGTSICSIHAPMTLAIQKEIDQITNKAKGKK